MAYSIGPKIGIDGEEEFRKAVGSINESLKTLKSEMGAVTAEFAGQEKSEESLTKVNDVLKRSTDELRKKLDEQQKALDQATKEYGENSDQAKIMQRQIFETTAEINKNTAEIKKNEKSLKELKKTDISKFFEDVGKKAADLGKTLAQGLAVAFAAVTAAATAAVGAIAKGVTDLAAYGDAIDKNSQKIGISAQAYQEWDYILQHAGSSIDALDAPMKKLVNAAYDGSEAFEKLGISQEELKSLSPEELFSRTIGALQNVSDETTRFGIATDLLGKGAQELGPLLNMTADETEGLRDSLHDLGGVISDDAVKQGARFQDTLLDIKTAFSGIKNKILSDFLPSINTAMDGIKKILSGDESGYEDLSKGIDDFFAGIAKKLPTLINKMLPILTSAVMTVVKSLSAALPDIISAIAETLPMIVKGIAEMLPTTVTALVDGLIVLINALTENMDTIVPALVDGFLAIIEALTDPNNLSMLLVALVNLTTALVVELGKKLPEICVSLYEAVRNVFTGVFDASKEVLYTIVEWFDETFGDAFAAIGNAFAGVGNWASGVWDSITGAFVKAGDWFGGKFNAAKDAIGNAFSKIGSWAGERWTDIQNAFAHAADWFGEKFNAAKDAIGNAFSKVGSWASDRWGDIKTAFAPVTDWFAEKFNAAVSKIKEVFAPVINFFKQIWEDIKNAFKTGDFSKIGEDIVKGLWEGISATWDWLTGKVTGVLDSLVGGIKDLLGIHSPSKVFAEIGENTAEGFRVGFSTKFKNVENAIAKEINGFVFVAKSKFNDLAARKGDAYAEWAAEMETMSSAEAIKRSNEQNKRLKAAMDELKDYDGSKTLIERGGKKFVLEGDTMRTATFADMAKFAFEPIAEAVKDVAKEIETAFVPENTSAMSREDFMRWKASGFGERESTLVRTPVTSAATVSSVSASSGGGMLETILNTIRSLPVMPNVVQIPLTIDGERVAMAIWNPLNSVAEQKGQPIINEA